MDQLIQKMIATFARQGLGALATYLVTLGIWTQTQADVVVGALIAVILFAWSWYKNHKEVVKVNTALKMPQGSTHDDLKDALDAQKAPAR